MLETPLDDALRPVALICEVRGTLPGTFGIGTDEEIDATLGCTGVCPAPKRMGRTARFGDGASQPPSQSVCTVRATDCNPAPARAGHQRDYSRSGKGTAKLSSIKQSFANGWGRTDATSSLRIG